MGIRQSILGLLRSEEDEQQQQQQQLHPFLDNGNYRKSYNGASFGSSSFAKSRKPEPTLPVIKPTNNPPSLQVQYTSSSPSDSYSSPNTTYPTPSDFQLQSYHYSSTKDEVHATTTSWPQKLPVSSAMESGSNEDEGSHYIKQMDATIYVPSFDYKSLARTNTSAMQRLSNENEGLCHIKQMDVILDVPSLDYQSLAHTNTFDVVSVFSIKNEEKEVEEVEEDNVINCYLRTKPKGRRKREGKEVKGKEGKWVNEGKWITHYNSNHWILLVGEGDFSFSASLVVAFGYAPNVVATSLDSEEFLKKNYSCAMSNIEKLRRRGCTVIHGIDATKIATPDLFGGMVFDRIIFNFPFAGFFKDLSRNAQLRRHRRLVSLFLKNAKELVGINCEIHISHKTNNFHNEWNLTSIASSHGLRLIEEAEFNQLDYLEYNTKRGFGGDDNFDCYPAKTYKFGLRK